MKNIQVDKNAIIIGEDSINLMDENPRHNKIMIDSRKISPSQKYLFRGPGEHLVETKTWMELYENIP